MGIETALMVAAVASQVMGAFEGMEASKDEARQIEAQGKAAAESKATQVKKMMASQKVSFLKSGLEFSGTAKDVPLQTYDTGLKDVSTILDNYRKQANLTLSKGRSQFMSDIGSAAMTATGGGMFGSVGGATESVASVANQAGFGNTAYTALDAYDTRADIFGSEF